MKNFLFLAALLVLSCKTTQVVNDTNETRAVSTINFSKPENVAKTLSFLASDALEGRDSGSEGIEKASVFLEKMLKENVSKKKNNPYRN